jgi:UDPglucose 6-dehydrogenase
MRISVIGLGKLGAVMAAVVADAGFDVVGVDLNQGFVDSINNGEAPVQEPGLPELIVKNRSRLRATTNTEAAVADTDVTFIIVPTPSGPDGAFALKYVLAAGESIGRALRAKDSYHLVVISSTVMPGSTASEVLPLLEEVSGKKCGEDFGLCYNPEFIALGSVIRDMSNPDMILIGESDEKAGSILEGLYAKMLAKKPATARMSFVNAELTKLSVNTYVTTKISYANMLAEICEHLDGADVDVVSAAIGLDTRIGRKYLKGGMGYGGPCFPRDNVAFSRLARQLGVTPTLSDATHAVNQSQVGRLVGLIRSLLPDGGTVGVLGLSYKPATNVVEESQGLFLMQALMDAGVPVVAYDPLAMDNASKVLKGPVRMCESAEDCAGRSHLLAVTTAWEQFKNLQPGDLNSGLGRPTVVDCWRILNRAAFEEHADYVTLGQGRKAARGAAQLAGV